MEKIPVIASYESENANLVYGKTKNGYYFIQIRMDEVRFIRKTKCEPSVEYMNTILRRAEDSFNPGLMLWYPVNNYRECCNYMRRTYCFRVGEVLKAFKKYLFEGELDESHIIN